MNRQVPTTGAGTSLRWFILVSLGVSACAAGSPTPALADEAPGAVRVLLVSLAQCCSESSFVDAEARIVRELEILDADVAVQTVTATGESALRREFLRRARRSHADVTVCVMRARHLPGAQLWVSEVGSTDVTSRYLYLGDLEGDEAAQIAGLKAVEAIVGCRQDLRLDSFASSNPRDPGVGDGHTLDGVVAPPGPEASDRARFRIGIGPVLCGSRGGLGARGGLQLSLTWAVVPALSFRTTGQFAWLGPDLTSDVARATFDFGLVRGWWLWHLVDRGPIRAATSVGGGLAVFVSEGTSEIHLTRRDSTAAAVVGAGVELSLVPLEQLRFRVGVGIALLGPEVTVQFDGNPVATFGRPLLEGTAAIVVGFP